MADLDNTIVLPEKPAANVSTPGTAGDKVLFMDSGTGFPSIKDSSGVVTALNGTLTTFNGRSTAAVVPQQSDYDAFFLTPAEGNAAYDAIGAASAVQAASQPLDATLTSLAGQNWSANSLPIGSGADTVTQVAFAANTFPARSSSGNLVAKSITDYAISTLLGIADAVGLTAIINLATTSLKGLMSTTDKKRMAQVFDAVADFGFVGDLVTVGDGACSTGAPTKITSATLNFTTNAVLGQRITLAGAGASGAMYVGTISNIDSGTQVTVSPNIQTTVSAKTVQVGTDNTAAITTMMAQVNNATFPGVKVVFGQSKTNSYGFPTPVTFNQHVQIEGIGGGHTADSGDATRLGGTRLAWWGSSSDGGVTFGAFFTYAPTGAAALKRVAMRHCWLDCRNGDQNQALIGVKLASCHGFLLESFYVMDPLAIGIWTDIASSPTEAKDATRFTIRDFCIRLIDMPTGQAFAPTTTSSAVNITTAQTLTLAAAIGSSLSASGYGWVQTANGQPTLFRYSTGGGTTTLGSCIAQAENLNVPTTVSGSNVVGAFPGNACGMFFNGGNGANSCCGVVEMGQISQNSDPIGADTIWGPAAIECGNGDSIIFEQVMINGGDATNDGALNRIRKAGIRMNGSATATLASRNNVWRDGDPGPGGFVQMGVLNTGVRLAAMAQPNYIELQQFGNGAPAPVAEGSSYLDWDGNGTFQRDYHSVAGTAPQVLVAATANQLITGSVIPCPPQGFQPGTVLEWTMLGSSTAAGVAANTYLIGTSASPVNLSAPTIIVGTVASGTPTAAATLFEMKIKLRVESTTGGVVVAKAWVFINGSATGMAATAVTHLIMTMTNFANSSQQFISAYMTTGAAKVPTIDFCQGRVLSPGN